MSGKFWVFAQRCLHAAAFGVSVSVGFDLTAAGFVGPTVRATGVSEGELLLGELNCVACHRAPEAVTTRLNSRGAPKLGAEGLHPTPQWLTAWLTDPSQSKPGSAMPQLLHGVPEAQRREASMALTHYLVSLAPTAPVAAVRADPAQAEVGKQLYHSLGCVACHAPLERGGAIPEDVFEKAKATAVPFGNLAAKYPAGDLVRFLLDPVQHRPGGRMPSSGLSESEATSVATYLLRDQLEVARQGSTAVSAGLQYDYYEGRVGSCAELERRQPKASGTSPTVNAKVARRGGEFGLRFQGALTVPADGDYTFSLNSDDGSQLYLDGKRLVDVDGEHPPTERSAKTRLTAGPHGFVLLFFQNGAGYELNLRWEGPGFARREIGPEAFTHSVVPLVPLGQTDFRVDPAQVARGRDWFAKLNCAACHAAPEMPTVAARPLMELASRSDAGCLAEVVPAKAPKFDLTPSQRGALRTALTDAATLATPLSPAAQVANTMTRLNCLACHAREGKGGPLESGRADWFHVVGEADLGDEGRIPPHLNAVGAKLKPAWLQRVLQEGAKARPYMATRMPRFGTVHATALQSAFLQADRAQTLAADPPAANNATRAGWKLVGRDGLNCIACHTFSTFGSTGIPALALDAMAQRLEWDWFRRYLPDPAALRPGTRMPTFWPEGQAVNTTLLGGKTGPQIEAIWAWLQGGAKAETPTGLIRGQHELVVDKEAVIYRNFIDGAGSRAIGVGYPEHANLAFDANELRLAMIWQGSFIDTARHSTDRGVGYEPPLGDHLLRLPGGPAFASLGTATATWPAPPDRLTGANRFLGYTLDAVRRPTFRYQVDDVVIEETPTPKSGDLETTLVRHFKLSGRSPGPFFLRAATGKITPLRENEFRIDQQLHLKITGTAPGVVVGSELGIPVPVPGECNLERTW